MAINKVLKNNTTLRVMQRGFTFFSTVTPSGVWGVEEEEEGEDSQKGAL